MSGAAVEKVPQNNDTILGAAFTYKLIVENTHYVPLDPAIIDLAPAATNGMTAPELADRINRAHSVQILQTNSHDLRLRFRWPLLPNGEFSDKNGVTYRAFTGGWLMQTPDFYVNSFSNLFFFQPATYVP